MVPAPNPLRYAVVRYVPPVTPITALPLLSSLELRSGDRSNMGSNAAFSFAAEQRVAQIYAKFCKHRFMEVTWNLLQNRAMLSSVRENDSCPISANHWMILLAQDDDAGVTIESWDRMDPSLGRLLTQLAKVFLPAVAFLKTRVTTTRLHTIDIVAPTEAQFTHSTHLLILHETIARLAILLRLDARSHRVRAYMLVPSPVVAAQWTPLQLSEAKREFMVRIVNLICVFLWTRLPDAITI